MDRATNRLQKIFISHATPEDNYFASWLAVKLKLLNYDVWCEVDELVGGEDFWNEIEDVIRNQSVKFISVISANSLKLDKRGFRQELKVADNIRDRGDFIIPVCIDDTDMSQLPMELSRINVINFSNNWAQGLRRLVERLEKDNIPTLSNNTNQEEIFDFWKKGIDLQDTTLVKRDELHWINWFELILPDYIYVHIPQNIKQFQQSHNDYPYVAISNFVVSFADQHDFRNRINDTERIPVQVFLRDSKIKTHRLRKTIHKSNHVIIDLLNQAFSIFVKNRGLKKYDLSRKEIYYFPVEDTKISLRKYQRTTIQLNGKKLEYQWHFAIGHNSFLYPLPVYSISSHIIFTLKDKVVDKTTQHQLRRDIGKNWWNKQWRDHLLGSVLALAENEQSDVIQIPVGKKQIISMQTQPIHLISETGYLEPKEQKK